ncbi:MAG: response regulator [Candidatus Omnitrophica bacterium]|nr:response regulator [Candidatus Omnitrophota bacterium]
MSKILFVEDDLDFLTVMNRRLIEHGHQVMAAFDCFRAVELAHNEKPDVIVLDLKLPGGGGLSTLKNLKLSLYTKDIPVIISTAMKDDEQKKLVLQEKPDGYLEKPYDSDALIRMIEKVMLR